MGRARTLKGSNSNQYLLNKDPTPSGTLAKIGKPRKVELLSVDGLTFV
jgi:hypothetical protein